MSNLSIAAALACGGEDAKKADTPVVIHEEDMNARDTTPTPPPSPIGRMHLMGTFPTSGTCRVTRYRPDFEMAYQVTYDVLNPRSTATLDVGKPSRGAFTPVSLQIIGMQSNGVLNEQETIFVGFSNSGTVKVGNRTYTATGSATANERQQLRGSDSAEALAYARAMMEQCGSQ